MKHIIATAAAALTATVLATSAASATTFTFDGGSPYGPLAKFNPSGSDANLPAAPEVMFNTKLGLSGKGNVTFTYVGSEAGYKNSFWVEGARLFDNRNSVSGEKSELVLDGGALNFSFATGNPTDRISNGGSKSLYGAVSLFKLSDTSVYALYNDSHRSDTDFDDLVVRIDVAPVPLPAAAWLLMGGIGALGAASRRRRNTVEA